MKKYKLLSTLALVTAAAFYFNGCILDAFDELVQNLSIERNFTVSGNTNNIPKQSETFKLGDSQLYQDNKDKIKKLKYKAAAFCVTENNVPALQGNIILTLKTATGIPLFTKTLTGFKPNDYLGVQAKDLDLTQTEIDAINSYLSNSALFDTISFTAELEVQNATPANTNVILKCFISVALEMTVTL
ncbi:MAG: hypothetical protein NTX22_09600 [Ignavibacteriales bacterium]|nr:hypothetical protein [Ignavibacteriales bacterium]